MKPEEMREAAQRFEDLDDKAYVLCAVVWHTTAEICERQDRIIELLERDAAKGDE